MTCAFVRDLTIQTGDLGKEATLVLMFHSDMECIYHKLFPVIWRTTSLGEKGRYSMRVTYTNQLAFCRVQVNVGNIVDTETHVQIDDGKKTTLTQTDDSFKFSVPKHGLPGYLEAINETGFIQHIAIGTMNPGDSKPKPVLYFKDVEHVIFFSFSSMELTMQDRDGSLVKAKFALILRAYISSDHKEASVLEGAICTDSIWEQDLAQLPESTTLTLSRKPATGHYTITQEGVI
ncbi:uncharacterized protein BJ212DRAFT_1300349 [Suillus subaureus]|uniref:Uncharacterized protein n=1 Tax=Suillus subaureus TaxID=48587 RepID=A0A9P7EA13_9AGAM|nr:uncharacterized protein BJ212DRAFT_1300349 [Suillus subaureus]KAG1815185.1 hypothetical protein BJ212DRAFT_1300349 [Suillus subaureus]